jgi:hypothetical protein
LKSGENGFEDPEEWKKDIMEDHGVADTDRHELVREARSKDLAQATVEGRVYVVMLDSTRVKSAEQARTSGKAILLWCAARTSGKADSTGGHGETGASHAETPAGYLGELAGTR